MSPPTTPNSTADLIPTISSLHDNVDKSCLLPCAAVCPSTKLERNVMVPSEICQQSGPGQKEWPKVIPPECDVLKEPIEKQYERNAVVETFPTSVVWPPWNRRDGWSGWMSDTVTSKSLVMSLIIQAFSTGQVILDATTYLDFSTFASNQTGNTILLTVAIVRLSGHLLLLTGVSLGSFLSAALVFGHLGHFFGLRRRAWLLVNVFFQIMCLVIAAIFLSPHGPAPTRLGGKHQWTVIMLFAIMSGAQVAAARQVAIQEIPTAPMTSSYVDLVGDKYLLVWFTHKNAVARNRRLAFIMAMIAGSFIGAVMHKYAGSWVVVVVAMAFKFAVVVLISIAPVDIIKEKM
nr:hypothetical protein L204_02671 [Cryptococcus depauperatus CBS 7855]